ncbi:MAG TPA: peptide-N4-asparagine amidase [Terriglobia bacterium]|nr:peptide-N4-asparagine amidase [Terriglobia bacterium]
MCQNFHGRPAFAWLAVVAIILPAGRALGAQSKPSVGSQNVSIADPALPAPSTKPCVVQLFPKEDFGPAGENTRMDSVPHTFSYEPPANCKTPWAKVVLQADFSVDPGHQYDRTASIWLNGVSIYFGTTQEPSPDLGPHWQIERDLTDYCSLLHSPGKGAALINNWTDPRRASVIHASARILFYPADADHPAPRTPDAVYAVNATNEPANLQTGEDQLARKIKFPRNTERIYLDEFAQSQFHDEFWYTCLPDKYIQQAMAFAMRRGYKGAPRRPRACSGGSYREVEVLVDGQPAGLAPIFPWVYTGGIDPYLWRPTPGVQTLNFIAYRVDLTPFAGLVSDGAEHSVAVRVLGSNHYFSVGAALLVYRNAKAEHTGGAVTRNTLKGASLEPTVTSSLGAPPSKLDGDVVTRADQSYVIEGYVNTPTGRIDTRVEQHLAFNNNQKFSAVGPQSTRHITEQSGRVAGSSTSSGGDSAGRAFTRSLDYSLTSNVLRRSSSDHSRSQTVHLHQVYNKHIEQREAGLPPYTAGMNNTRDASDEANFNFDAGHAGLSGNRNQTSKQVFAFTDSLGDCYKAELEAQGGKVTSFTQAKGCKVKPAHWFVHPTGAPNSFGWRKDVKR